MGLWSKVKGVFGRIGSGIKHAAGRLYNGAKNIVGSLGTVAGTAIGSAFGVPQVGAAVGRVAQNVANALPGANV